MVTNYVNIGFTLTSIYTFIAQSRKFTSFPGYVWLCNAKSIFKLLNYQKRYRKELTS